MLNQNGGIDEDYDWCKGACAMSVSTIILLVILGVVVIIGLFGLVYYYKRRNIKQVEQVDNNDSYQLVWWIYSRLNIYLCKCWVFDSLMYLIQKSIIKTNLYDMLIDVWKDMSDYFVFWFFNFICWKMKESIIKALL